MKKIAILAPNDIKLSHIQSILSQYKKEIIFEVGSLEDGLIQAKKLRQKGIEVIIARGETAFNIRDRYPDIVVVAVPITGIDFVQSLEVAKQYGGQVAVVSFPSMMREIERLESALGVKIRKYGLQKRSDVDAALKQAVKDGADVILGGYTAMQAAKKYDFPYVEFVTGDQVYLDCFHTAKGILQSISQQKRRSGMIKTVLNHAYEGILSVDEQGLIYSVNPIAQRILQIYDNSREAVDKVLPELGLSSVLRSGREELNQFLTMNNIQILCNKVPILDRGRIIGAVATFQDVTKIQNMESKIRHEFYAKGHRATYHFQDISAKDLTTKELVRMAKRFAVSEANILLSGETGVGKEVFAQSIHNYSKRKDGPFVAVNCAALPAQLLESELFGYVSGAFTGAKKEGKPGLFEVAHGGTIFLDEIGEMDYVNQGRLLRVLQERSVVRLGSTKVTPVNVRVLAATNRNLEQFVKEHKFREDLYYRLNVLFLSIAPLRERKKDIIGYAHQFLEEFCRQSSISGLKLSSEASNLLEQHPWPGNIRELRNVIQRVVVLSTGKTVSKIQMLTAIGIHNSGRADKDSEEAKGILAALQACDRNLEKTAEKLSISRSTLWRKMRKFGL
ncbi:MAG: sigma 54-interacting transcriptional regulator [Sporomusaceae bacterium]|nr:sigma 54-interacting transcriptional regulator [Sporomusaceae bacterium]